ncbi:MAG: glycosyl transferase [Candidatus Portnoybacteria bacterium CG10_big_fil_rev_8_21_14_0_10_36_7]|uniref:Glycosyl transferase n=1 Tax=Candidatus Portnoybacteria bacterium CG10_big_fil_rev_8_21_14_0_10_36_7 TaxID=1974812 RepID=A0A2M8KEQ3_9BACT|nr:MAG: glycosyl transferase [Candidatus Portnoybacteria bacterium CG10_big_fil_rev_8_21_14_0_10_36_7]
MRIAQLASNYYSIPPKASLAIYHLVGLLTKGLVEKGHDVTLYATKNSETSAKLEYVTDTGTMGAEGIDDMMRARLMHLLISRCYEESTKGTFDIIHSHFNLSTAFYAPLVSTPTVHTFHSPLLPELVEVLRNYINKAYFISISLAQRKQLPELNWAANIYHGVNTMKYTFNPNIGSHLLFMGRVTEDKGAHIAIEVAKATGLPLIIAGKSFTKEGYWHKQIEPHIDGKNIKYVGEPDHQTKINYLKSARALLFPVLWEEPFGMVMIEAMSCGTPVVAFKRGSVPEIIKDSLTGYIVKNIDSMVKAVKKIDRVDRRACRDRVEQFFRLQVMVNNYEKVYSRIIEEQNAKLARK